MRLAILTSHPIQYNAPLFAALAKCDGLVPRVFYCWEGYADSVDKEFGKRVDWDIPLLEGYDYCFEENRASDPGTHHFFGLVNPSMLDSIEKWSPDALLVYGWSSATHVRALRYFKNRIPVFFRGDSTLLFGNKGFRGLARKIFLSWIYRHVDHAFYAGQYNKAYFEAFGLTPRQLHWAPHSVDNEWFRQSVMHGETAIVRTRQAMGIGDDEIVILFAGKLVDRKKPLLLLEAAKEVASHRANPGFHLVIVGDGVQYEELCELSAADNWVHMVGFQNQSMMPVYYGLSSVYVLPSVRETWGLGVNEAMACGKPCIVSDLVGCALDLVHTGRTGEVVQNDSVEALSIALRKYIEDPGLASRQKASIAKTIDEWSVRRAAECMHNVFDEVVVVQSQETKYEDNQNLP